MDDAGDGDLGRGAVRRLHDDASAHVRLEHRDRAPLDEHRALGRRPRAALEPEAVEPHVAEVVDDEEEHAAPVVADARARDDHLARLGVGDPRQAPDRLDERGVRRRPAARASPRRGACRGS